LKRVGDTFWRECFIASLNGKNIRWKTQHYIESGDELLNGKIPDLVLFADEHPVLVIEAKVDAIAYEEQLQDYASWLGQAGVATRPKAVVLLHRDQRPLPPCLTSANITGPQSQQMGEVRWIEVRKWLLDATTAPEGSDVPVELWSGLGQELATFMLEINVVKRSAAGSPASLEDMQAAQSFFAIRSRFDVILDTVNDEISDIRSVISPNQTPTQAAIDKNRNVIWSWVWLTVPPAVKWYAAWGFYFPTPGDHWSDVPGIQSEGSQFFVSIESEGDIRKALTSTNPPRLPDGWKPWPRKGLVKTLPVHESVMQSSELSAHMARWTAASLREIWPIVQQLAASLPSGK
jgi:hypothetical protein